MALISVFSGGSILIHILALTSNPDVTDATSQATVTPLPQNGWALFFNRIEFFITVPLVYIALVFCLVMIVLRLAAIFRAPPPPYSLKIYPASDKPGLAALKDTFGMPQVRRHKPMLWFFLAIFHLAFLLLILGHLDLFTGISLLPETSKHMLGAGLVGVFVTLPLFYFLFRRFRSPVREITVPADYLLLILIIFLALFGDLMSWGNSWTATGFIMTKQDFGVYLDGLARFTFADPRQVLSGTHYHFLVIHVLLADLFFIILPFSKVVHAFLAMPINLLRRK
jgi:nitrate reductase gamma subunit